MRSGDRPTGDTSATDPSAIDAEPSGTREGLSAGPPWETFQQADEPSATGEADTGQPANGQPAAGQAGTAGPGAAWPGTGEPAGGEPTAAPLEAGGWTAAAPLEAGGESAAAPLEAGGWTAAAPLEAGGGTAAAPQEAGGGTAAAPLETAAEPPAPAKPAAVVKPKRRLPRLLPRMAKRQRAPKPAIRRPSLSGPAFARLTALPAILVMAWLLAALPLLLGGVFLPAPALVIAAVVAVVLITFVRRVPEGWPRALSLPGRAASGTAASQPAWFGLAGTFVVAAAFTAWQLRLSSDTAIVVRNPGAYLQTAYWLAQHGSLPIPQSLAAFGGAHPGLNFASTGFYSSGGSVVPGVMSGLPLLIAAAFWVHGITAGQVMGPIIGGLAVLAFGGLAGRLAGPRWAPAAALVLALTLPQQYTSRAPFAETAMQVLLFGGMNLVLDALALGDPANNPKAETAPLPRVTSGRLSAIAARLSPRWYTPQRAAIALGGLALGLTTLVRIDGLFDLLPAIVFAGVLVARRLGAAAVAFLIGLVVGVGYGLIDGYVLARPLLSAERPLPEFIGLLAASLALLTVAWVQLMRVPGFGRFLRRMFARWPLRWLPAAGAVLVIAVLAGLAARPYLQTVRGPSTGTVADYVASLQRMENLPVSGGRLYAEDTLYWAIWYVGVPAVLLGFFGAALVLRRCLRSAFTWRDPAGTARMWALPLAIIFWGSAVVLWQPATVPDQPWASRRLVPLVIPGLVLLAIWASAVLRDRARSRGASRTAAVLVAGFCVVALLVPTAVTTFGASLSYDSKAGSLHATADGLGLKRIDHGETGAVQSLCSSLGASPSVVIVDATVAQDFTQAIRGMCGVPVASMSGQSPAAVQDVISGIDSAGRRPVLLGAKASQLYAYGGSPVRVLDLSTTQEPHTLSQPPTAPWSARYVIWMTAPSAGGVSV